MNQEPTAGRSRSEGPLPLRRAHGARVCGALLSILVLGLVSSGATGPAQGAKTDGERPALSIEETRLTMGKMIETQQIISKERKEWTQGKEILLGRLELVRAEVTSLEEKIQNAENSVAEAQRKRDELLAENERLVAVGAQLTEAVAGIEAEVRRLLRAVPEPILTKLQPLTQRMPEPGAETRISAAERFQNVLGILNELNKANNEITVSYEVRQLADGRPAEVRALYVGLAQAYYVSASGEAGIGRPTPEGWQWQPSRAIAGDVLTALEIIQGKHTPAFVPLPVTLQ